MRYFLAFLAVLFIGCKSEVKTDKKSTDATVILTETAQRLSTPDVLLGELFTEVQLNEVFEDGKTFVDCTAKFSYEEIRASYENQKSKEGFDLTTFVLKNFEVPASISSGFKSDKEIRIHETEDLEYYNPQRHGL